MRRLDHRPILALGVLLLCAVGVARWLPEVGLVLCSVGFALLGLGWSGRAAWFAGLGGLALVSVLCLLVGLDSAVAAVMFTVPPYVAGTALRLRRETADQLALRALELEEERELFVEIAVRHERARIASELHDVVGHTVSVMVIQAAAGQRLVDTDPKRTRATFAAISESARQGTQDLERLVDLLGGRGVGGGDAADLSLVDEVVARSVESGLHVSCDIQGDRGQVSPAVAHLACRVVQESLTNVLRHVPGADVRVVVRIDGAGGGLVVQVDDDGTTQEGAALVGTGRGLVGLGERVRALGGTFAAGATGSGGWSVEARLPAAP